MLSYVVRGCFILGGIVSAVKVATLGRDARTTPVTDLAEDTAADGSTHRMDSLPLAILSQRAPFRANRFVPEPAQPVGAPSQASQPEDLAAARITGFVMGPRAMAVVEALPGAPLSVAIRAGDMVGDWLVRSISMSGVVLERSGRVIRLTLPEVTRGNGQ